MQKHSKINYAAQAPLKGNQELKEQDGCGGHHLGADIWHIGEEALYIRQLFLQIDIVNM